jgi:uncharacterized membrane protein
MDSALIKSLLFGKMESYLIFLSIVVSMLIIYRYEDYVIEKSPDGYYDQGKIMLSVSSDNHYVSSVDSESS